MMPTLTDGQKRYSAAKERFLKPALIRFVEKEFPQLGGPLVINLFTDKLLEKIDEIAPLKERVKPGQMVWNALDKHTRADSPKRKTKSVILTVVSEEEVEKLEKGAVSTSLTPNRVASMCREAYQQDTLLSMRDLGLIFCQHGTAISRYRIEYEQREDTVLPHTGSLHDQGTTLTHKTIICKKVKQERKDPAQVARETNHSQRAVDNYLKGYERVKSLQGEKSASEISFLTGMSKHLVEQYKQLIKELEPLKVN